VTPFSHEVLRLRPRQESSVGTVAFLVHTQINVSTPEEVFFFPHQKGFFFGRSGTTADGSSNAAGAAAEQQQTAAASARQVAALMEANTWKRGTRQS